MNKIHEILERAAREATRAIIAERRGGFNIREKSYKDLVTACDIASEKAIMAVLEEAFPGSSFNAEESGQTEGTGWLWVIDPIDGTHNFIFGLPNYAISIGGAQANELTVALIYAPETKESFFAYKNEGAYKNGQRIRVSTRNKLEQSMIAYDNQFSNHPLMLRNFKPVIDASFTVRILGSAAVDLCHVAQGVLDARILHKPKIMDVAAGVLMVEEAGGCATDINGERVTLNSSSVVASNGQIHESLLSILAKEVKGI
jgi:myo-inositol-1(or 4)-monophosphatase